MVSRRDLLAGAVGAAVWRPGGWEELQALGVRSDESLATEEPFWEEVRSKFYLPEDYVSLNHVGLAPPPIPVFEEDTRQLRRAAVAPTMVLWREMRSEIEDVRRRLAPYVGVSPEELALTPNATYGLQTAILGMPLTAGRVIATTAHDYPRTMTAIEQRMDREPGVEIGVVPLPPEPLAEAEYLERWRALLETRDVGMVVCCTVTYLNGHRVPVEGLLGLCRERGIPVLVDGAQTIGLLPTEVGRWGCEAYTACLHKWLMCPVGTGVFAVRRDSIEGIWPMCPADRGLRGQIQKFEQVGSRALAPILAIKAALDFHDWLGMERKFERLAVLKARLYDGLATVKGVRFYGERGTERQCGFLSFGVEGESGSGLAAWLMVAKRFHVTTVVRAGLDGVRVSPNVFTRTTEIDAFVEAIRTFAGRRNAGSG